MWFLKAKPFHFYSVRVSGAGKLSFVWKRRHFSLWFLDILLSVCTRLRSIPLISKHTESHYYSFYYGTLHQSFGFTVQSWWWEMESTDPLIVIMKRVVIHSCLLCLSVLYRQRWGHPSLALHRFSECFITFHLPPSLTPHLLLREDIQRDIRKKYLAKKCLWIIKRLQLLQKH